MNLSTTLKQFRTQKGIRQQELAHYLKVSFIDAADIPAASIGDVTCQFF